MRIAIAGLVHETNTFARPTGLDDFTILRGEEITETFARAMYVGGFLAAARAVGADVVPTFWAGAYPSGTIAQPVYEQLRDELVESLQAVWPFDAIALEIHGAAIAAETLDVEGDLAGRVRDLFPGVPIVAAADLHGSCTDAMNAAFDLVLPVELYPHTDTFERGYEAVQHLPVLLDGSLQPATHLEHLPMILPCTTTDAGSPGAWFLDLIREVENVDGVVDCSIWHGFPYADTPDLAVHVAVTTNGNPGLAADLARDAASRIWLRREEFRPGALPPEEAVAAALRIHGGPVVINEASDNPGGGTPGDGTHLLRAMLEAGLTDSCFGLVCDPAVVATAWAAGPGATIEVELGGKTDDLHGKPLAVSAVVEALTDGVWTSRAYAPGMQFDHGRMARLRIAGIDVLVSTKRSQVYEPEVFLLHGIDVTRCRVVGVKSANHFRAGFREPATAIITADSPGLSAVDPALFERKRLTRGMWPLDGDAAHTPD